MIKKNTVINFQKQPFADVSQYLQETPMLEFPFTIVLKETPTQALCCEYCEIFQNNLFSRTSVNGCFRTSN